MGGRADQVDAHGSGRPGGGCDKYAPANVSPVVAWLASDDAADVSGQVFVMWGAHAYLMKGWSLANFLDAGEQRFTIEDLVERKGELFAPVNGTVVESNEAVVASPELVNSDPFGEGWLIKVEFAELPALLSFDEYTALTGE